MEMTSQWIFWISVGAVLYTYLGYPCLLLLCHPFLRRQASRAEDSFRPTVSIILAAYNEESCIREKLENCLRLDYPRDRLEILVGSDASEDGTNSIAAEFSERGVRLFAYQERSGKMAVVNRLVAEATGEICVFSDISELFDRDVILKLVQHFADAQIGAVTGNHIYDAEQSGMGVGTRFYWSFQRLLQSIESRLYTICMCDGTIYAARRQIYVPPADNTINDDVAVPLGIILQGKRVIFEASAVARGKVLQQTRRFFRQKIRSQSGKYQIFFRFLRMLLPWPPARFWIYLSHSVLPVLVPWFLLLAIVFNAVLFASHPTLSGFYGVLLLVQGGFYFLAALGLVADYFRCYIPLTAIPFYFVTANIGSIFGFFAYLAGAQSAAWRKVE